MKPVARKDKLTTSELPEETLVYDLEGHKLHCLNRPSSLVWKHCDGRHDTAALAAVLARELGLTDDEAAAAARLALEQLGRRGLLQEAPAPAADEERLTRRRALRKMVVAAAAAIPLVMTLKSPSVAWADTIPCGPFRPCPAGYVCLEDMEAAAKGFAHHSPRALEGLYGRCALVECGKSGDKCTGDFNTQGTCCSGCFCENGVCSCTNG
jgi:hypothetical protein